MTNEIINIKPEPQTEKPQTSKQESNGSLVGASPVAMMELALSGGLNPDKLERMLELQERWEANEAKKAFTAAMAAFKRNPPEIEKDRKVSYKAGGGLTEYRHASLANVTNKINAGLSDHGLSASWVTEQQNGTIKVTCTITHCLGHSESTSLNAAPDVSGSKNSIQAIGSTISYLERYTILALTGLATSDMDNDAQITEIEYISAEQVNELTDLIDNSKSDRVKFLAYMQVEEIGKIPAGEFKRAKAGLVAKLAANQKKEAPNDSAE